jgi:hypothetical protein
MVIKERLWKVVTKKSLLWNFVTTKMGETVTIIFNGYLKTVKIVSNSHIRLTILAITEVHWL